MQQVKGFWLPDRETRIEELLDTSEPGKPRYQRTKFLEAMSATTEFGLALDIGAHVGFWSLQLADFFRKVIAFEPDAEKYPCFDANIEEAGATNITLYRIGLSDHAGSASLTHKTGTSLKTHVNFTGNDIELRTLDSFNLSPDFIKIDVEGYELPVVKGATQTIMRSWPTIIVEQKPGVATKRYGYEDQAAVRYLEDSLGYSVVKELNGDFILTK